jgi:hypothetical protein
LSKRLIDWATRNYENVEILGDDPIELPERIGIDVFRKAARIWWEYGFPTMRHVYDGSGLSSSVLNDARHVGAYILAREEKFAQPFGSRAFDTAISLSAASLQRRTSATGAIRRMNSIKTAG